MDIWIIADTHFGHQKLVTEKLRAVYNDSKIFERLKRLPADSMLIHLGDVCMGNDARMHQRFIQPLSMPTAFDALSTSRTMKKILVRGNHDHKSNSWYLNHGWDFVCTQFRDKLYGVDIVFTHEAIPLNGTFDLNLHGHNHDLEDTGNHTAYPYQFSKNHMLLSIETNLNYGPISLRYIVEKKWKR